MIMAYHKILENLSNHSIKWVKQTLILGNLDQLMDFNLAAGQSLYDQPS